MVTKQLTPGRHHRAPPPIIDKQATQDKKTTPWQDDSAPKSGPPRTSEMTPPTDFKC